MKIANKELEVAIGILYSLELKGKDSRMRTRFINFLRKLTENFHEDRFQLLQEYGETDEEGNFIFQDKEQTTVLIEDENKPEFNRQFFILLEEETILEENEVNKMMILSVGESLLNADIAVSNEVAEMYDILCERFEEAIKHYQEEEE